MNEQASTTETIGPERTVPGRGVARRGRRPLAISIAQRVARGALVLFIVTFAAVGLLNLAPGSAADVILGANATPATVHALNVKLGLNDPVWQQYLDWLGRALRGDLGQSPITGVSVSSAILQSVPVTLEIVVLAMLIALVMAVLLGVLAAATQGSVVDRVIVGISSVFLAVPAFVAGPVLVYALAVRIQAFPPTGWVPLSAGIGPNLQSAFLPALAVALTPMAVFIQILRSDLVGTLREDFVLAARSKGMAPAYVMFRHVLRPSSFSLITVSGISFGQLIGGTVVVEVLFGLPGLGQLIQNAISQRDIVMVQGVVVFIAIVFFVVNTLVDISYSLLDPRVRKAGRA